MSQVKTIRKAPLVSDGDQEAYSKLEEQVQSALGQMDQLQATIVRLRAQQNSYIPAFRVADDILITIFFRVVEPGHSSALADAKDLLGVTSTCRRWRAIAIDVPRLWSSITLQSPDLFSLFLARSRSVPLSVNILDCSLPKHLGPLLGSQTGRLRSLRIELHSWSMYHEWMDHLYTFRVPSLEHFSLTLEAYCYATGRPIFGNTAPSLRSLSLNSVHYPPTSPFFSNLRHLSLHDLFRPQGHSLRPLLEILSRSPGLETLSLLSAHVLDDQYSGPGTETAQPVSLACLRRLDLVATHPYALRVFPYLALPDAMAYDITIYTPSNPPCPTPILTHPLPFSAAARSVKFIGNDVSIGAHISAYREERPTPRSEPLLGLRLDPAHEIGLVMDAFDFRSVVRLEVTSALPEEREEYWSAVLERMPTLHTVVVAGAWTVAGVLGALTMHVWDEAAEPGPPCLCPALEHLELRDVTYGGRSWVRDAVCRKRFWPALKNAVSMRCDMGAPVKSVSLFNVDIIVDQEMMEAVREQVDSFVVHTC